MVGLFAWFELTDGPTVMLLAEISDKMPTTFEIVTICLVVAVISVALASVHRVLAWGVFLLVVVAGSLFALGAYHESCCERSISDAIWRELGLPWVVASIGGPFLPAIGVAGMLILRRPRARN